MDIIQSKINYTMHNMEVNMKIVKYASGLISHTSWVHLPSRQGN